MSVLDGDSSIFFSAITLIFAQFLLMLESTVRRYFYDLYKILNFIIEKYIKILTFLRLYNYKLSRNFMNSPQFGV